MKRFLSLILALALLVPLFPAVMVSAAASTKTGRTLYTDEMVAAARENIGKYSWAKTERDKVVAAADRFVALGADYIWNNITSQEIPRAYAVAFERGHPIRDPYEFHCRYCNADLLEDHGNYPWTVDAVSAPWKIKCPECSKVFPSNDFAKFYELGRTKENGGLFNRKTALEAHRAMLIEKNLLPSDARSMTSPGTDLSASWYKYYGYGVEGGYLHNDLYPEVGRPGSTVKFATASGLMNGDASAYKTIVPETTERWGVDDGLGYNTGRVYKNGLGENHSYIPYYNHFGVWYFSGSAIAASALDKLGRAYLYTGDEKYGRLGAIILDRVADVYPTLNLKPWTMYPNSTGGSSDAGKDLGRIWGCFSADIYAQSYDIFWPMYEDAEVIAFLSAKASYYGMENDKTTAEKIRKNVADGTCREIFTACKNAWLYANFGIHQQAIIKAAIALDEPTETKAMIDWAFAASKSDAHTYNTGGDISHNIVDIVYRDGNNAESPVYNQYAITELIDAAVALDRYADAGHDIGQRSLLSHPKYVKMINAFMPLTLTRRGLKGTGDAGAPAEYGYYPDIDTLIKAFGAIKDNPDVQEEAVKLAQQLALRGVSGRYYDIFTPNAGSLQTDVNAVINTHGNYNWDKSTILTGYGYGILRDGTVKSVSYDGPRDTQRDFMLNFSAHPKHNHADWLDLGMEAYGIPFTSDFGYAEFMVTGDPHSNQLTSATIGHNTVVVNEKNSSTPSDGTPQYPLHFDAKDTRVKVMDASTPVAYASSGVSEYRRTVVMVDYDDDVSYGVDFFHIEGGNDHLYTFMPNSNTRPTSSLSFVKQVDQPQADWKNEKNYYQTSSYAGPTVQFGRDPLTSPDASYTSLKYPRGYTWFYDVERADNPGTGEFYVDYKIEDFRGYSRNGNINPRLRITMLNDFNVNEVSLVSTIPQRIKTNEKIGHLEKVFVRRKGENLDSLFTAVYEPYRGGNRYVDAISSVSVAPIAGTENAGDEAKAVKVELEDGRVDYVVYATNKDVTYKVTDTETGYSFDFSGFVGVWTLDGTGNNTYSYLNDGSTIGTGTGRIRNKDSAITGTVTNFQKELSLDNWADVTFDEAVSEDTLAGLVDRMIIFDRSVAGTGAYLIEGVTKTGDNTARISFGSTSTIDGFVDAFDESKGYKYIIEQGKSFSIPMSYESVPYDGKLNYVFAHDAHFSSKGNGGGSTYTDVTKVSFDDTDPAVSTGAWGNLTSRNSQSLYASGMSSSLSVHRNGNFINLAFDPAKYNSSDGYYTYYSKLKESAASGPIAMIAIDVPKTGRFAPSMSAIGSSSSGQVFEVYLIRETAANKSLSAANIRAKLSLDDRIGAYDSSVGGLQKFADCDLVAGTHYLTFVPVERGAKTGTENKGQVYLQPQSFHLDPVEVIDTDPYNPDALGSDGKVKYALGAESFNSANKVYENGSDTPTWYFGDTVQNINDYYAAIGEEAPTDYKKPLNTWTDQSAEAKARDKYIPWTAKSLTDKERGHVLWLRNTINPYLYFGYDGVFERNYEYLNLARTDKWQFIARTGNLDSAQVYARNGGMHNQIKANGLRDLGKGNECTILKIDIPSSGQYDITIDTMNNGNHVGFAAYLVPATKKLPQTYAEREPYQIAVGKWDANLKTGKFTAYTAGEYYFIFESFKTEDTTTPDVGRWDVDIRSLTLTATGPATVTKSAETIEKEAEKAFTAENPMISMIEDTSATVTVLARETSDKHTADKELERVIEKTTVEKAGDVCTVEAPEIEGYTFRYWGIGLGRMMMPVSTETEYSFKAPKGNTFISAFYSYDKAEESVVEFYNANGEVISRKLYTIGDVIEIPELPSLTGVGDAIGWVGYINGIEEAATFTPDDEIIAVNPIMTFTAAYDEEEIAANKSITITAEGSTGITGAGEYVFGDVVTLTAPYRQNEGGYKLFVGWKKDGEIVSCDLKYTFNAATDTTVTAVYAGFLPNAVEAVRKILVSAIGDNATVAEFIGCEGALERGFIFDGNGVEDAKYKYPMKTDATSFTMGYDTGLLPRAYAIFENGVIYSK